MPDLALAIAHHLAVFALVGALAAEFALLRTGIAGERLRQLRAVDAAYGGLAGLVIIVGVLRVGFGAAGWEYYVGNWVFWLKLTAFLAAGLLSIQPTLAFGRWQQAARSTPGFTPPQPAVNRARRFLVAEAVVLASIPAFAAALARGYGS